jgi:transmembrane sensor
MMKKIEEIEFLIGNYLKDNCTREEFEKVIEILKDPNHNYDLRSILLNKWNDPESQVTSLTEEEKKEIRQSLSNIHHQINLLDEEWESESKLKKISDVFIKIAAALLLPVMVASLWYFFASRNPYRSTESFITVSTPNGSRIKTELPDGTVVWQNSGSTVKYPRNFTKRNRQVILTGEAYFDVKSDKLHPFFVTTRDLQICVSGTRFNVTGYEDEELSSIVLESGHITAKKLDSGSSHEYSLVPGDRLESIRGKGEELSHNVDVDRYISWIDGKLIFRNNPLEEVLKRLSRWYNVEIIMKDPNNRFSNLPFTMTIENESLPQILEYLKHAAPFSIKEEKLTIKEDGSFNKYRYIIEYKK